jgi:hypothetical protein
MDLNEKATFSSTTFNPDNLLAGHIPPLHKKVTLLLGENRTRGAVLGKITASGKYKLAQNPAPILAQAKSVATGGTLAAGRYYYVVSAVLPGGETAPSNEVMAETTGATSSVVLNWQAVATATAYRVYRATASGLQAAYYLLGNVLTYTDTNAGTTGGSPQAATDGSDQPDAILAQDCDATLADTEALVYTRADVNAAALTIGLGWSVATLKEILRDKNIQVVDTVQPA